MAILLAAISATLVLLLQAALLPSLPHLRRRISLVVELTILVILAGTGMVTVVMVVTDTATGRRATTEITATAADEIVTMRALAAMVRDVATRDTVGVAGAKP